MINIFTLDGKINMKNENFCKLKERSPKIKMMCETSVENEYILDDCLQNELVNIIMYVVFNKILKNTQDSLNFLNETCPKFEINIMQLNISSDLLLLYLSTINTKSNVNSPHIKIGKLKIIIDNIHPQYYDKYPDKLILKIKSNQYICTIQKVEASTIYVLNETDYYVIKHKYKHILQNEQQDALFAEIFSKSLKYPPIYFEKIIESVII